MATHRDKLQAEWNALTPEQRLEEAKTIDHSHFVMSLRSIMTPEEIEVYKTAKKARQEEEYGKQALYIWGFAGMILLIMGNTIFGKQISSVFLPSDCDNAATNRLRMDKHIDGLQSSGKTVYDSTYSVRDALKNTERSSCN